MSRVECESGTSVAKAAFSNHFTNCLTSCLRDRVQRGAAFRSAAAHTRTAPPHLLPCAQQQQQPQPQHRERLETFDDIIRSSFEDEDFVTRDDFEDVDQLRIGNDGIFMLTFFMAFLFNWIGFFLSFCLTTSAAGRYGAISGFGLSLIKWVLIVRFSTYFPGYFDGQYWLWWVFLVLGFLLFLRGFINYARIRKMADTLSTLPRTRVLFIY
ncbi:NEDD4 family-interacting protein 1-like isoform X6 [Takifugu flavidus]|uniref:NEDD4 family-interacting protein 1-like isoform X6 n=1 Tax=Takifugu flavidus TaxID=433684 RepID=UPI002544C0B1|nr:NEDD4 family-interacting protein 1-like isoform X6 [Takifugu flavidus]